MPNLEFLYTFNYDYHLDSLCKLESRQIFDNEEKDKLLFSPFKIDPSISAFIKNSMHYIDNTVVSNSVKSNKFVYMALLGVAMLFAGPFLAGQGSATGAVIGAGTGPKTII